MDVYRHTEGGSRVASGGGRTAKVLKGFRDFLPEQMILRNEVIGRFREIFERHGFEPLETPAVELLEVLTGKAGENEKLMYTFADHGGRAVGLRYDLTVPLARVVAQHQNELVFPFKRYHVAPVWRADNPQRGRFREFWQCDVDIAGTPSMLADAEIVAVLVESLAAVGLANATVAISDRRLLACVGRAAGVPEEQAGGLYRAIDKLDKIGPEGVAREMAEAGIGAKETERVLTMVTASGEGRQRLDGLRGDLAGIDGADAALADLDQLFAALPALGVSANAWRFDLALARGLDYYTGPVFEATVSEPKVGSVAGGGRYDGLVGAFLGRPVPAVGVSLGLERILEVVKEFGLLETPRTVAQVAVAVFPATVTGAAGIARELRAAGLRVDLSLQPNRSVGDQLKLADRRGIPLAVIVGENELAAGSVAVKDLRTGEQQTALLDDLPTLARRMLDADHLA
jgi:histidyl-tRNA synthetase